MSNPLHSSSVSDPAFPLEPDARAEGRKSSTHGQYRRDLPGHASEQLPMKSPADGIFRIWSTERLRSRARSSGRGTTASFVTALLRWQAADAGDGDRLAHSQIRLPRALRQPCRAPGQSGRARHSGLARRPNSGNMDWPWWRRFDVASRQLARDQWPRSEIGTGLARMPPSKFVRRDACSPSRTSAMRAPALSTR